VTIETDGHSLPRDTEQTMDKMRFTRVTVMINCVTANKSQLQIRLTSISIKLHHLISRDKRRTLLLQHHVADLNDFIRRL